VSDFALSRKERPPTRPHYSARQVRPFLQEDAYFRMRLDRGKPGKRENPWGGSSSRRLWGNRTVSENCGLATDFSMVAAAVLYQSNLLILHPSFQKAPPAWRFERQTRDVDTVELQSLTSSGPQRAFTAIHQKRWMSHEISTRLSLALSHPSRAEKSQEAQPEGLFCFLFPEAGGLGCSLSEGLWPGFGGEIIRPSGYRRLLIG
jgi:hypothetical protein